MEAHRVTPGSVWSPPDRMSGVCQAVVIQTTLPNDRVILAWRDCPTGKGHDLSDLDGWGYVGNVGDVLTGLCLAWGRLQAGRLTWAEDVKADRLIASALAAQAKVDNARTRRTGQFLREGVIASFTGFYGLKVVPAPENGYIRLGEMERFDVPLDPVREIRLGRSPHRAECRCVVCKIPRNDGWGEDELKRRIDYLGRQAHLSLQALGVWLTGAKKGLDRDR